MPKRQYVHFNHDDFSNFNSLIYKGLYSILKLYRCSDGFAIQLIKKNIRTNEDELSRYFREKKYRSHM